MSGRYRGPAVGDPLSIIQRFTSILRTAAIVLAITLVLDFCVSLFIPASIMSNLAAARDRDIGVYDHTVRYHHDLRPNSSRERVWGIHAYPFATDAHGLRTGKCAGTGAPSERDRTVLIVGDSFIEGVGVSFERSVAGLLACAYQTQGLVARNLGVSGYSPVIYHRKLRTVVERLGYKPRQVVVFLDISDIYNDTIGYFEHGDRVYSRKPLFHWRTLEALKRNLMSVSLAFQIRQRFKDEGGTFSPPLDSKLSRWTYLPDELDAWARRGLDITAANLDKSVELCRDWRCTFTLIVYPWPDQVNAGDLHSIQVSYWRQWAETRNVRFINAFEAFFRESKADVLRKYFIPGDVHWSDAGHSLMFEEVWPQLVGP